jgi:CRISPR-associated protein Csb2
LDSEVGHSLTWLESLGAPVILAPKALPGQIVRRFVPNNDGNKVPDRQLRLTAKTSRPTIMQGPAAIHYIWLGAGAAPEAMQAIQAARYLSCLGWGIDVAFAHGRALRDEEITGLEGVRWTPNPGAMREDGLLRVPIKGSICDLRGAHKSAVQRIEPELLRTLAKPRVFDLVLYSSAERPVGRPYIIFALRDPDGRFYAHQHHKLIHIAGMARNACIAAMSQYPPECVARPDEWVDSFVAGHRRAGGSHHQQLSYIPLPSIGHEHSDALIRRVMISAPYGSEKELRHIASQLEGRQLQREDGDEGPTLDRLRSDGVARRYTSLARTWASVTPVILPGHDDHKPEKTARLIERAMVQSGIEHECQYTWASVPNFPNCLGAHKYNRNRQRTGYFRPDHLENLTAVHLRLTFEHPVAGPVAVGAGRHCGFGVLATED